MQISTGTPFQSSIKFNDNQSCDAACGSLHLTTVEISTCLWHGKVSWWTPVLPARARRGLPSKNESDFKLETHTFPGYCFTRIDRRNAAGNINTNISSVVEVSRWWVLKSKIFALRWPGFKDFIWFFEMEEQGASEASNYNDHRYIFHCLTFKKNKGVF